MGRNRQSSTISSGLTADSFAKFFCDKVLERLIQNSRLSTVIHWTNSPLMCFEPSIHSVVCCMPSSADFFRRDYAAVEKIWQRDFQQRTEGQHSLFLGRCLERDVGWRPVRGVLVCPDIARRSARTLHRCQETLSSDHSLVQCRLSSRETQVALCRTSLPTHRASSGPFQLDQSAAIISIGLPAGAARILADSHHEQLRKRQKAVELAVFGDG